MLSKKPKNLDGAKKLLEYFGTAQAINIYNPLNPGNLARQQAREQVAYYSPLQKKEAALIASDQAHRAVHGPRHAARLRLDGDDPVAAVVPEQARPTSTGSSRASRSRRRRSSDRERCSLGAMATDIAASVRAGGARQQEARRPSLDRRPDRDRGDGRDPGARHGRADLVPDDLLDPALVHELGRDRRRAHDPLDRHDELPPDRDDLPAVLAGVRAQPRSGSARSRSSATPFGMFLAYQLDKQLRGSRIYQSLLYLPVVIAPAIIGLIAELYLLADAGPAQRLFEDPQHGHADRLARQPEAQPLGRARLRRAGGTRAT